MVSTISSPVIPCIESLPDILSPGKLIRISGTPSASATCFAINLQTGSSTDPRSDIALHLSPVFSPPPRLVRNSLENQNWGPEESHGAYFPFACEESFEILILPESDHFKIAVNGQHFTEFYYRLPLQSISHISIDGDVLINEIKFEGLAKSPMETKSGDEVTQPLGFVIEPKTEAIVAAPPLEGRPHSLPYPANPSFGPSPTFLPSPTDSPYGPPPSNLYPSAYGPPQGNMYPSGRVSPSPYGPPPGGAASPYGPPPGGATSPYGPPPGDYPYSPTHGYPQQPGAYPQGYPQQHGSYPQGYPQQQGPYPQGYPQQQGSYPGYPYPSQVGPYPGTSVVYPGQEKKSGGFDLGPLAAAGAAALAGATGAGLLGHKKHKKHKHGYGMPGMAAAGPASLISGVGSLLTGSGSKHGHGSSHGSSIPLGGALAGGAAALAGTYMLSKSPMGKMMKPKKMKKMYKGWGSSSSSSSSSD